MLTYISLAVSSHVSSMAASFPSLPLTCSCLQVYLKLTYALEFMILVLMIAWRGGKHTGKQKENGRSIFRYACSSKDIHKSHAASCIISPCNLTFELMKVQNSWKCLFNFSLKNGVYNKERITTFSLSHVLAFRFPFFFWATKVKIYARTHEKNLRISPVTLKESSKITALCSLVWNL